MADDPFKLRDKAKHFLADDIYKRLPHFPKWERFALSQHLRQEGLGLMVKANRQNYQRGLNRVMTIDEMIGHKDNLQGLTWLARELGYNSKGITEDWEEKLEELSKMIWALRSAAQRNRG